jgi:hypothetical protein
VVEAHRAELEAPGTILFAAVEDAMRRQAYANWKTMLDESLVRASTIRYLMAHKGGDLVQKQLAYEVDQAQFLWTRELVGLFSAYEQFRPRYPTLESFMPRIVAFFKATAPRYVEIAEQRRKKLAEMAPKVASISPANGAADVDPATKAIVVTFDRPMRTDGYSVMYLGENGPDHFPALNGEPVYSPDGMVLVLPVTLKPEWVYRFCLNDASGGAFRSRDGVPLARYEVTFTTGKAKP